MATAAVRKRRLQGLLFISPWIIGFVAFTLYPFISSIYYSLTSYDVISPPEYIGLENYANMMTDPLVRKALYNTFYYAILAIPLSTIWGICVALMLNLKVRGMTVYGRSFTCPVSYRW